MFVLLGVGGEGSWEEHSKVNWGIITLWKWWAELEFCLTLVLGVRLEMLQPHVLLVIHPSWPDQTISEGSFQWILLSFSSLWVTSVPSVSWIYTQCNRGCKASALNSCQLFPESPSRDSRTKWFWPPWAPEELLERQINVISLPHQGGKGLFSCPEATPTRAVLQPQPVGCWFCFHYLLFTTLHTTRAIFFF